MKLSNNNTNQQYNQPSMLHNSTTAPTQNLRSTTTTKSTNNIVSPLAPITTTPLLTNQTSLNYSPSQQQQQQQQQQQKLNSTIMRLPINIDTNTQLVPNGVVSSTTPTTHLLSPQLNTNQMDTNSLIYSDSNNSIVNALMTQLKSPNNNNNNKDSRGAKMQTTPTKGTKGGRKASDKTTTTKLQQQKVNSPTLLISPSTTPTPIHKSSSLGGDLNNYCFNTGNNIVTTTSNFNINHLSSNRNLLTPSSSLYLSNFAQNPSTTTLMSESNSPASPNSSNSGFNNDNVSFFLIIISSLPAVISDIFQRLQSLDRLQKSF
jgi:hypothetical protein